MKCYIDKDGIMNIISETGTESYALANWINDVREEYKKMIIINDNNDPEKMIKIETIKNSSVYDPKDIEFY